MTLFEPSTLLGFIFSERAILRIYIVTSTTNLELLNKDIIDSHLTENFSYSIEILSSITSTNDYVLNLIKNYKINSKHHIVLAEEQTAGRAG